MVEHLCSFPKSHEELPLTSRVAMATQGSYKEYEGLECSSVVLHLPNMCEVLGSILSSEKKKRKMHKQERSMSKIAVRFRREEWGSFQT